VGWSGWIGWKLRERKGGDPDRGDLYLSAGYGDFFDLLKNAYADNAILKQAEAEYDMLR
jgi:hypothetical protein